MPNRVLRDGILSSERVALLGWAEEVFYRRLHSVVDDYGRFHAHTSLLLAACYPLQLRKVSDSDIGKWLLATEKAGLVRVYPASDGKRYLEVLDFGQRIQSKSKFPAPTGDPPESTVIHGGPPESTALVGDEVEDDKSLRDSSPARPATCPHEAICSMWNERMPELPAVRQWTEARRKLLQARWREAKERQTLGWWQKFFDYVRQSDFLMGRSSSRDGHSWECSLPWLLKAENFAKVIEGNYDNRGTA